jgi:hypothetical protein
MHGGTASRDACHLSRAVAAANRPLRSEILHLHHQRRGDPREGMGEGSNQRAVAQIAHGRGRNAAGRL